MDLQEEQALVERSWRHIDAGTSESREPSLSPVERYIDPQRHQLELERVFREWPIAICPAATLAEPGASFAIDVAGLPLLLVRAENGTVHGHVNACRHRGARLQAPGLGQQRVFVCPYHSWTYGLDGALRGRPHPQDFPQAPPAECSLAAVPVGEALGMLWVIPRVLRPGESACLDMTAYLGRFGRDLRSWGYDSFVPFDQRDFINRANWKMPFEANLELYHVHYAHRNTIKELFHDNLMIADVDRSAAGPHHQRIFIPKRSITSLREQPRDQWKVGRHVNIIYFFFPSTFFLHEGDHVNMFSVLPDGVGQSRVLAHTMIPEPPASDKALRHWQKNVQSFWNAFEEDFAMGVSSQSTMTSGANRTLYFGTNEWCSSLFHADVEAACGLPTQTLMPAR
jgi:phenylpropionate dioxygenase-like ring-hydroxylating dioxygenase large terminal subunit